MRAVAEGRGIFRAPRVQRCIHDDSAMQPPWACIRARSVGDLRIPRPIGEDRGT